MRTHRLLLSLLLLPAISATVYGQETRLLRQPTLSRDLVAFAYAGDIWVVARNGGEARRLTATPGVEADPRFSPDGTWIAFTRTVAGNTDVYAVPTEGGAPTRLSYHPGLDRVRGWTPDGQAVVFASTRGNVSPGATSYLRLWTVPVQGGWPEPLPMPRAFDGMFSPDGRRIAYAEISVAFFPEWDGISYWRHYRGGRTRPVWVMNLADHSVERLPSTNSNDTEPMWVGDVVYFLSDRNYTTNVFSYRFDTGEVTQLTNHDDFDVMNASAGPDAIVYEQAGYVHLLDVNTLESRRLAIEVHADLPWTRPQFKPVARMIRNAALSPTGVRATFEARGDIFTVPTAKGDSRNLTRSPGVHDRNPVWSPDGAQVAWFSDASGEYQLMLGDQTGGATPRAVPLPSPSFFSAPAWSPDGSHLLLKDNHLNLWMLEVSTGRATKIDTDTYHELGRELEAAWSPDSRWITYSKVLESHLRAIFVYSLADGTARQVTDGMSDATSPVFDAGGKYLYFLASTNYGPSIGSLDMSTLDRPVLRSIYLAVLEAGEPSPLLPESGDEPAGAPPAGGHEAPGTELAVRIDFDGIRQRILALNVPVGDYGNLVSGSAGMIFYTEPVRLPVVGRGGSPPLRLHRYQLQSRSAAPFLEGIRSYTLSADHNKLMYLSANGRWGVVSTAQPAKVGDGILDVTSPRVRVEPRKEWVQMFDEAWRIQREYFYDPAMHGADWEAVYDRYRPLVEHVAHADDFRYLIAMVGGELVVGHSYVVPGEGTAEEPVSVGLVGADFAVENGRYRIRRIYTGENWNPELRAPLSGPGIQVMEGEYLLEVNGQPLAPPTNLYSLFEGTAGRQTQLRIGDAPSLDGSRLVTVVPVASEGALRLRAWVEGNRRTVDELSDGRLAYIYLPNTSLNGYSSFNRYFYAQQHKEGAIIDDRYNQGGMVADYIVNELDRELTGYFATRDGTPSTEPISGLFGPKVMVINESAGSGGDALPYIFRLRGLGPLIGTRTWGGLVGTTGYPPLMDGTTITAPNLAFYDLSGRWAVENEGVAPDVEVENTPADVINGHDPQLERAVEEALRLLAEQPVRRVPRPPSINRVTDRRRR